MRNFGIEIEFNCKENKYQSFLDSLLKQNIKIVFLDSYDKSLKHDYWILTTEPTADPFGYELVSPILSLADTQEIKMVLDTLKNNSSVYLTDKCGLHIHIDTEDHNLINLINVIKSYWIREKEINEFIGNSRENNIYCLSNEKDIKRYESYRRLFKKDKTKYNSEEITDFVFRHFPSKNRRVSLVTCTSLHTVEFRQHEGTVDFLRVFKWIGFLLTFIEDTLTSYPSPQEIKVL
jgi:hypothetical protein